MIISFAARRAKKASAEGGEGEGEGEGEVQVEGGRGRVLRRSRRCSILGRRSKTAHRNEGNGTNKPTRIIFFTFNIMLYVILIFRP